jgi:hypothetical protein
MKPLDIKPSIPYYLDIKRFELEKLTGRGWTQMERTKAMQADIEAARRWMIVR